MKQEIQARYPVSADVVLKAFADPAFHQKKLDKMGGGGSHRIVDSKVGPDESSVRVERKVPIKLPGVKLGEATATHEERWSKSRRSGSIAVDTKGVPVKMSGVAKLVDDAQGCIIHYTWTIESGVPLLGGQIEKAVAREFVVKADEEARISISLLGPYK